MLSKAATRILKDLKAAEDRDDLFDAEVVCDGRSCYVGLRSVSKATVNELLRLVLICVDSDLGAGVERYSLNEEGRAILENSDYVPKIVIALAKRKERKL